MKGVEVVIRELAHSSVPVLLIGERGTGKQTIARRIHTNAGQPEDSFRTLTCSESVPDDLAANLALGGTVYLSEIGDLNLENQARLMTMLLKQNDLGTVPVRLIGGSSRDLEREVRNGTFREDLYYRLSGVCLRIPPLRQRREDIPGLTQFFLYRYAEVFQRPVPALSAATLQLFAEHSWPGNLNELESAVRAIAAVGDESVAMSGLRSLLAKSDNGGNGSRMSLKEAARAASREVEKEIILKTLARTRWNRRRAAQDLQISYKALLYKLKQIGCEEYGSS
jgi:two-component system response regulator AtoC